MFNILFNSLQIYAIISMTNYLYFNENKRQFSREVVKGRE